MVLTPQESGKCNGEHGGSWRDCPGKDSAMGCYLEGKQESPQQDQSSDAEEDTSFGKITISILTGMTQDFYVCFNDKALALYAYIRMDLGYPIKVLL